MGSPSCGEIHWHIELTQTGNTLSKREPCVNPGQCRLTPLDTVGEAALGGSFPDVTAITGSVTRTDVTFTITISNGRTFTFNGAFSATGNANPWLTGTISGATLPATGITWERQAP